MTPPADVSIDREIGKHEEAIDTLKKDVAAIRQDMDQIKEILQQARGGWKTLVAVGSLSSGLSALFTWMVSHLWLKMH